MIDSAHHELLLRLTTEMGEDKAVAAMKVYIREILETREVNALATAIDELGLEPEDVKDIFDSCDFAEVCEDVINEDDFEDARALALSMFQHGSAGWAIASDTVARYLSEHFEDEDDEDEGIAANFNAASD